MHINISLLIYSIWKREEKRSLGCYSSTRSIKNKRKKEEEKGWTLVTYQKSTRCAEKSGTGDDLGGQYKEKLPIRIKFPSPCRLGRIPTVSLARAVVYSTSNSAMITMEIMIDEIIEEE